MKQSEQRKQEKQENAIAALLTEKTVRAAANTAGVSESALWDWLKNDRAFRDRLREARRELLAISTAKLQKISSSAVNVLQEIAEDTSQKPASRVLAARSILEYAYRGAELEDLQKELEEITQELKNKTSNPWGQ